MELGVGLRSITSGGVFELMKELLLFSDRCVGRSFSLQREVERVGG